MNPDSKENPDRIEVRVTPTDLVNCENLQEYIVGKLEEAGVPVRHTFGITKLSGGFLTQVNDYKTQEIVFIWTAENPNVQDSDM